jgi:hypothetical protein
MEESQKMSSLEQILYLSLGLILGSLLGAGVAAVSWIRFYEKRSKEHERQMSYVVDFYEKKLDAKNEAR